ncbi:miniconductance mechanosensitive channel [Parelusimicrobium proximum]|uniref:mechanosensitive ion channel family protein n=1 Tax=Parelusimicrobium proximum TaxID=3228953 RepID=UPI003D17D7E0
MNLVVKLLSFVNLPEAHSVGLAKLITFIIFAALVYLTGRFFKWFSIKFLIKGLLNRFQSWKNALLEHNFFAGVGYLAAGILAKMFLPLFFPPEYASFYEFGSKLISIYMMICFLILVNTVLSIIVVFYGKNPNLPVKGSVQAIKIVVNCLGILVILSFMLGKKPSALLATLGVMASVFMLVFKDPIMGLVATFQLHFNDMLRIGDWIEMPKHGADGDVIDISLTNVSVQNWDKTIVTIPSYDLISSSFKNWRGMSNAGGRRVKRAIKVDVRTIKFLDKTLFNRLKKIELLTDYMDKKEKEIEEYNNTHNINDNILNARHLTNIGTFRAYCEAYLNSRDFIHKTYTSMVRQLEPDSEGLPLEIYTFISDIRWVQYEAYQADIFDHFFAVMPEFELAPFQDPSGRDFEKLAK